MALSGHRLVSRPTPFQRPNLPVRWFISTRNYPADAQKAALTDLLTAIKEVGANVPTEQAEKALVRVLNTHLGVVPNLARIGSWAQHLAGNRRAVDLHLREAFAVNCHPGLLHVQLA